MKNKNYNKLNSGITLVALVVTIVVLLILAGVSINLVLGENGLITQAKEAREQTKQAEKNETEEISNASDFITQTVVNLPRTEETMPYAPSSEFSVVEGTNLNNGLVIEDADGNQYVWVEVPMTIEVYKTTGLNVTEFNPETYKKIEDDLHQYTMAYRKGKSDTETAYKDEYAEDTTDGWFKNAEEYNEQKYKMLKSVYQNGGFWVGRYEAGIEQNRIKASTILSQIPKSKQNLYPYVWVLRTQAKVLAESIKYENYTGSLMFGVQWDLMLAFIHNKENIADADINNDSKNIGNYYDATYTINRGKYAKYGELANEWKNNTENLNGIVENKIKLIQESYENGILLTTGASEHNCLMNIYDIAGNVWEWTLEFAESNNPCAMRGGRYGIAGSGYPASCRGYFKINEQGNVFGFRISIY